MNQTRRRKAVRLNSGVRRGHKFTEVEVPQNLIALAIGFGLLLAGGHALRKINLSMTSRVLIGAVMLVSGIALIYPLLGSGGVLEAHQIRFGIAVALGGLGINQLAAPVRATFGRPV